MPNAITIAVDQDDILANTPGHAWRGVNANIGGQAKVTWRRAGEGEVSRDGLWVVGGGQWLPGF